MDDTSKEIDELAVIDDRNLKLPCVEYTRDMERLNAVTFL